LHIFPPTYSRVCGLLFVDYGSSPMIKKKTRRRARASAIAIRQAILEAALTVFSTSGFDGASTRAIASAAGVEQGHLAYYFKSKEALWREVITTFTSGTEALLVESLSGANLKQPLAVARVVLPEFLRLIAGNHRLARLMLQEFSVASSRHDKVVTQVGKPIWQHLRPLFEALQANAGGTPEDAKLSYYAMIGSALLFFGSSPEVRQIAEVDPSDNSTLENYITLIVDSVLRASAKRSKPRATRG
jgi:TetR/AcrR family transcriptional regulator